ncbi:DNA repair protein RecO [Polynucleobacter hallstattensis]|uniref:DNA repair protein RecO n=1 Tax=Polynucleobacter hallstattensis TaxID=1855586 RepID=UPI001C0BD3E8|nr:DNA repair protein RecO [Polynucleobacter hallstattensis]MBU3561937.1 DNA repair protein RecO [Polynucleobacter hallstattensis]
MASIRVADEPAFVLHSIPYKETSLILDVFTRQYGRMALIAKGAKRPHSVLRPVLQRFQPLLVSWSGQSELRTLTKSEWVGGTPSLVGDALLCGFYLNELLVKFLAREDDYEILYDHYTDTISALSNLEFQSKGLEEILRPFELTLLQETGYAAALDYCVETHSAPVSQEQYVYQPERGVRPVQVDDPGHWPVLSGKSLLAIAVGDFSDQETLSESKQLMRFLLGLHLQDQVLTTRQILIDLKKI